jgi:hypothetical protein
MTRYRLSLSEGVIIDSRGARRQVEMPSFALKLQRRLSRLDYFLANI